MKYLTDDRLRPDIIALVIGIQIGGLLMAISQKGLSEVRTEWQAGQLAEMRREREDQDLLEKLRKDVVSSATDVRRAFLIFGAFSIYLIITVGSTTHLQLLIGTVFELPLLSVNIPILGFYVILPLIYILAHFNLLGELNALADDVKRLKHHLDTSGQRLQAPIPFGPARTLIQPDGSGVPRGLIYLVTFFAVVIMPPLILLLIQIRFLPYHAEAATWLHRGLILLDICLVVVLWFALKRPDPESAEQLSDQHRPRREDWVPWAKNMPAHLWMTYRRLSDSVICTLVFLPVLFVSLVLATVPNGFMEKAMTGSLGWLGTIEINGKERASSTIEADESPPRRTYHGETPAQRKMFLWTYFLFEAPHSWRWMRRNLIVEHADLVPSRPSDQVLFSMVDASDLKELWNQGSRGIDLRGRDLRYAVFSHSELHKADLRGANLEGAVLFKTKLPYADLGDIDVAKLQACASEDPDHSYYKTHLGTVVCRTNLRFAVLQNTVMLDARLWEADLSGAFLKFSELQGADLDHVEFRNTKLQGVELSHQDTCRAIWAGAKFNDDKNTEYRREITKYCMFFFNR